MVLSVTLMVIAQMCIFYYVGGYIFVSFENVKKFKYNFFI